MEGQNETWLWVARKKKKVDGGTERANLLKLWREGKLTGMFNLPTLEVFNCCTDFVVMDSDEKKRGHDADMELLKWQLESSKEACNKQSAELLALRQQNESLKGKVKGLKKELSSLQQRDTDTLHDVVEQNRFLRNQVQSLEERIKEMEATALVHHREDMAPQRSQNDILNARLLSSFLRNIRLASELEEDSVAGAEDWGE